MTLNAPLAQICSIAFVLLGICALKVHHTIKVSISLIFKNSFHWHRYANATLPLLHICASAGFTLPEIFKKKGQQFIPEKILDTLRFVQANLHLPLTVTSLAERANQNSEYFSRTFEAHTEIQPLAYITEKRIERAQHMI